MSPQYFMCIVASLTVVSRFSVSDVNAAVLMDRNGYYPRLTDQVRVIPQMLPDTFAGTMKQNEKPASQTATQPNKRPYPEVSTENQHFPTGNFAYGAWTGTRQNFQTGNPVYSGASTRNQQSVPSYSPADPTKLSAKPETWTAAGTDNYSYSEAWTGNSTNQQGATQKDQPNFPTNGNEQIDDYSSGICEELKSEEKKEFCENLFHHFEISAYFASLFNEHTTKEKAISITVPLLQNSMKNNFKEQIANECEKIVSSIPEGQSTIVFSHAFSKCIANGFQDNELTPSKRIVIATLIPMKMNQWIRKTNDTLQTKQDSEERSNSQTDTSIENNQTYQTKNEINPSNSNSNSDKNYKASDYDSCDYESSTDYGNTDQLEKLEDVYQNKNETEQDNNGNNYKDDKENADYMPPAESKNNDRNYADIERDATQTMGEEGYDAISDCGDQSDDSEILLNKENGDQNSLKFQNEAGFVNLLKDAAKLSAQSEESDYKAFQSVLLQVARSIKEKHPEWDSQQIYMHILLQVLLA